MRINEKCREKARSREVSEQKKKEEDRKGEGERKREERRRRTRNKSVYGKTAPGTYPRYVSEKEGQEDSREKWFDCPMKEAENKGPEMVDNKRGRREREREKTR